MDFNERTARHRRYMSQRTRSRELWALIVAAFLFFAAFDLFQCVGDHGPPPRWEVPPR
jgi:hypothetical protein